jgi:ferredoxin
MTSDSQDQIQKLARDLRDGKITRREFVRQAALLGLGLGISGGLASCRAADRQEIAEVWRGEYEGGQFDYITVTPDQTKEAVSAKLTQQAEDQPTPTPQPRQVSWYCASCGQRFRTVEDLRKHAAAEHAWRLPYTEQVEEPTYARFLTDEIGPFSERNTVFSRTAWDKDYQAKVAEYTAKAPPPDREDLEGSALVAGSIYVDATAGSLHPNYYGYFGHVHGAGGLYSWDDPVSEVDYPVREPARMTEQVKQAARFYGANLVGITRVDQRWIYSPYYELVTGESGENQIDHAFAVVMGIEMNWDEINSSPGKGASAATALAYSRMAEVAASLAKYIRSLGYRAIPCGNDTAQSIPLAVDAGLGELGRNGLLLSPEYGPRQRICKVFTDLPLVADQPVDFGLQDFCESCHACAAACPVDAVRFEERTTERTSISNRPGIRRWPVNVSRCYLFWKENGSDCSNCIAACPWALNVHRDWLEP